MVEFEEDFEDEFEDEFGDEDEEMWEDYEVEEELDHGVKYIPAPSSVNFEKYAIFASFLMIIAACYFLYVEILGKVYDTKIGGESWFEKLEAQEVLEAQPEVEILSIGKTNPADKSDSFDFAVLNAGTNNGLSEGMIYYLETPPNSTVKSGYWEETKMLKKANNPKMLIIRKAEANISWADFCEFTTDTTKSIPDRVNVIRMSTKAYRENPTPDIPLPPMPRKAKKLQYFAWEEAYDISGEIQKYASENKNIPEGLAAYSGYNTETIGNDLKVLRKQSEPDKVDPNPKWNIIRRISLNYKDILALVNGNKDLINIESNTILLGENREKITDGVVLFKTCPFAYLAPVNDQRVFQDIYLKMKEDQ